MTVLRWKAQRWIVLWLLWSTALVCSSSKRPSSRRGMWWSRPKVSDRLQSVRSIDEDIVGDVVIAIGWVVACQSLWSFLRNESVVDEIALRLLSQDGVEAIKRIRSIIEKATDHGMVDLNKYGLRDILVSMYALSRLQHCANLWDRQSHDFPQVRDHRLLDNLAHYAVYANAAYGWKMDLAFGGRLHLRGDGDLQTLLRRTRVAAKDVLATKWESKTHKPAYFVVRDRARRTIVVGIRGTWSPHDVLTDLCCTAEECEVESTSGLSAMLGSTDVVRAHHGMLQAARSVQADVEAILDEEVKSNPDYELVIVGHSMGGGIAALLGILWQSRFPNLVVYVYGAPCVTTQSSSIKANIVSVVVEDDPFCCLSLGHVADVSVALSLLCEDHDLRSKILQRSNGDGKMHNDDDLRWCSRNMDHLRGQMSSEKLFPPGRVLLLRCDNNHKERPSLMEVPPFYFQDLWIRPRMFDLRQHVPIKYVSNLRRVAELA